MAMCPHNQEGLCALCRFERLEAGGPRYAGSRPVAPDDPRYPRDRNVAQEVSSLRREVAELQTALLKEREKVQALERILERAKVTV